MGQKGNFCVIIFKNHLGFCISSVLFQKLVMITSSVHCESFSTNVDFLMFSNYRWHFRHFWIWVSVFYLTPLNPRVSKHKKERHNMTIIGCVFRLEIEIEFPRKEDSSHSLMVFLGMYSNKQLNPEMTDCICAVPGISGLYYTTFPLQRTKVAFGGKTGVNNALLHSSFPFQSRLIGESNIQVLVLMFTM